MDLLILDASYEWNHTACDLMFSRFTHVVAWISASLFLWPNYIPYCTDRPRFVHSFICSWILFSLSAYCERSCNEHSRTGTFFEYLFSILLKQISRDGIASFEYKPRSGIAGSCGHSVWLVDELSGFCMDSRDWIVCALKPPLLKPFPFIASRSVPKPFRCLETSNSSPICKKTTSNPSGLQTARLGWSWHAGLNLLHLS